MSCYAVFLQSLLCVLVFLANSVVFITMGLYCNMSYLLLCLQLSGFLCNAMDKFKVCVVLCIANKERPTPCKNVSWGFVLGIKKTKQPCYLLETVGFSISLWVKWNTLSRNSDFRILVFTLQWNLWNKRLAKINVFFLFVFHHDTMDSPWPLMRD